MRDEIGQSFDNQRDTAKRVETANPANRDWFHKQMPTIESWQVARWIALFESQITRLAC